MSTKYNVTFSSLNINKTLDEEKYAQLQFGARAGYPRIMVFLDKDRKRSDKPFNRDSLIIAPFDYTTMGTLFDMANSIIDGPNNKAKQIGCFNTKWVNNERTNDVVLVATVEIGKSEEGIVYIGVLADGKKKVKFDLVPKDNNRWHKYYENGELITDKDKLSAIFARAYFAQARRLIEHRMKIETTNIKPIENYSGGQQAPQQFEKPKAKPTDTAGISEEDLF